MLLPGVLLVSARGDSDTPCAHARDLDSPRTREARLLELLHSTTEDIVNLVRPGGPRPTSAPRKFAFSSMATPKAVERAMLDLDDVSVPERSRLPVGLEPKPPVPPAGPVKPHRTKAPPFQPPLRHERNQRPSPPVLPLERRYRRGVASRLDQIQGTRRTPLSKVLCDMPAYLALQPSRQRELRELVASDAAVASSGSMPDLAGQSVRQVLAALTLRDKSSLRIEMAGLDRKLQVEQMRERMRGGVSAAPLVHLPKHGSQVRRQFRT